MREFVDDLIPDFIFEVKLTCAAAIRSIDAYSFDPLYDSGRRASYAEILAFCDSAPGGAETLVEFLEEYAKYWAEENNGIEFYVGRAAAYEAILSDIFGIDL